MRPFGEQAPALGLGQRPAGPRIEGSGGTVRRLGAGGDLGSDPGAGAETGIDELLALQPVQGVGIEVEPLGLVDDLPVPFEPEPEQILEDGVDMLGAGTAGIDILDAQQEAAVALACEIMSQQRRISVAQMQPSGGTWREASDRLHSVDL